MNQGKPLPPYNRRFTIALLGKGLQQAIEGILLDGEVNNVIKSEDVILQENNSFRVINTPNFFDENCEQPDQQIIDFMALSHPGPHIFILAVEAEETQDENVLPQIRKLQDAFGDGILSNLVLMSLEWKSQSLFHRLERSGITMSLLSGNLAADCKKWCSERRSFMYDYKNYSQDVVKRRRTALENARTSEHPHRKKEDYPKSLSSLPLPVTERATPGPHTVNGGQEAPDNLLNIVVLGLSGTGKSASANTILAAATSRLESRCRFRSESNSLPVTTHCDSRIIGLFGAQVRVIDTPDFFYEGLQNREAHIEECKKYCQPQRCLVLLVLQLGRFTDEEEGILERLETMLGWTIRLNAIVLLTHGEDLQGNLNQFIRRRPPLHKIVCMCGSRCHLFSNLSKDPKQVKQLMKLFEHWKDFFPDLVKPPLGSECQMS